MSKREEGSRPINYNALRCITKLGGEYKSVEKYGQTYFGGAGSLTDPYYEELRKNILIDLNELDAFSKELRVYLEEAASKKGGKK